MKSRAKFGPMTVFSVFREFRRGTGDPRPLSVAGSRELVPLLARQLREGGEPAAVVEQQLENIAVLIWVGAPDQEKLHAADRAGVPIVAISDDDALPYVHANDIVRVAPGSGFPVEEIAAAVARKLGEDATSLAARLPVLRGAVCDALITSFSRRNAVIGAAVFIPGIDMPVLTLNQIRLVLRIGLAHGIVVDNNRLAEVGAIVGAGFGFRTIARQLLDVVPVAGWAVKGGIAYTGTRAIGEAAVKYFEARVDASKSV
jgi:uncharacterized protein (DUF697 family)